MTLQKFPNYFIAVYCNGEVRKLSEEGMLPKSEVRFLIYCKYEKSTSTGQHAYYSNQLFDSSNQRIEDNTFDWDGIKCKINEKEDWEVVIKPSHKGVSLTAHIWDKLMHQEIKKFNNTYHNGNAFQELYNYLERLKVVHTHASLRVIDTKDKEIKKLKEKLEAFKKP
ncbi:hypothetical protein AAE02nite_10170 [Adhaeribacter aerolatus]|uniref:Uncharacterized protein n=1 Tax=Adhaeribacter aerolatus TaxID=670289 RepID=A0A512AUK3_9BACT|nr:hypothetical protein [Adhaeribacter aerolatus]GEO03353.1 hypothetical protein AAE02nite_10170 [Adhaeribacter aerolatus]